MDEWTDGWMMRHGSSWCLMDEWMADGGQTDRRTDGQRDERMDGWMDVTHGVLWCLMIHMLRFTSTLYATNTLQLEYIIW